MSDKFFRKLLTRASRDIVSRISELNAVRSALESGTTDEDPCTLLHIIGKACDQSLAPLVGRYLGIGLDDPESEGDMLRRLAIQILGQWWKRRDVFGRLSVSTKWF